MPTPYVLDTRQVVADLEAEGSRFEILDLAEPRDLGVGVGEVRRRRGRISDDTETGFRDVVLVERDGVLMWLLAADRLGSGPLRRQRRGWRALSSTEPRANVLAERSVPVLDVNEYVAALADTDRRLNPDAGAGLRLVRPGTGQKGGFQLSKEDLKLPYSGKTLLLVHGTFSSSMNVLHEYSATERGRQFLQDALKHYRGQVLMFDHPTLSVSPFLNGIDLARGLAGTTGQVDVIAHSRGGLVVRWWLDVLGDSVAGAKVRAILVGSPLAGTSLASPRRVHPLLSVLTNVGSFMTRTMGIAAGANPFSLAGFALLKYIVRREKNRWGIPPIEGIGDRPGVDAAVAVIPGLQGQSAVDNNYELRRLRASGASANVRYFAVTADFDPQRIGWQLWKVITEFGSRAKDAAVDAIFKGPNDLVVDTAHMTSLTDGRHIADVHAFGKQSEVHHCNYFRQAQTIDRMRVWLGIP